MFPESVPKASISMASSNPRDFAKKKRANRSSKLKQCKLDVRREQWLSQVRNKNVAKEEGSNGVSGNQESRNHLENEPCRPLAKLEIEPIGKYQDTSSMNNYSDSESLPSNSPTSHAGCVYSGNQDSMVNFNESISSSHNSTSNEIDAVILASQYMTRMASIGNDFCIGRSSSSSSSGFYAGNISEGDGGDDDCLDDWETMADALGLSDEKQQTFCPNGEICTLDKDDIAEKTIPQVDETVPHIVGGKANQRAVENGCAWRPDDAFRPRSLPTLSKQYALNMSSDHPNARKPSYGSKNPLPVIISCPICFEDFDYTDSNFLPCPCGFRICLFCHKRILEEDGRCPGCRKPY